jgi:hypothetical protein
MKRPPFLNELTASQNYRFRPSGEDTVQCCQMCSIQEDINRVTIPGWAGQPASYKPLRMEGKVLIINME